MKLTKRQETVLGLLRCGGRWTAADILHWLRGHDGLFDTADQTRRVCHQLWLRGLATPTTKGLWKISPEGRKWFTEKDRSNG